VTAVPFALSLIRAKSAIGALIARKATGLQSLLVMAAVMGPPELAGSPESAGVRGAVP
jgi:hypothetical protein